MEAHILIKVSLTEASVLAAALLIQGSACVYSKKVEHLHGLVHQALSVISDKRWACMLISLLV